MSFYTNVARYGNTILYRGYSANGQKVIKRDTQFKPQFFTQSKVDTGWRSLDGQSIGSIEFSHMREARDWLEMNKDVSGRNIFGNRNYLQQYIQYISKKNEP